MKKVFIGVLAALMIVAFTACEQPANVWNPNGKVPTALNIVQKDYFVEGQLFDPSMFSVEVVYENGDKEVTTAANVTTDATNYVTVGKTVSAALTYGNGLEVSTKSAIKVSTIDSLTITAPETWLKGEEMKPEDLTVVANYRTADGAKTLALDPTEYTVTFDSSTAAEEVTGSVKVFMAEGDHSGTGFATGNFTAEVTETAAAEWDGTISIVAKENVPTALFQRSVFNATTINTYFDVVKNMDDGTTVALDSTALQDVTYELSTYFGEKITGETDVKRFPEASSVTLKATYKYVEEATIGLVSSVSAETSVKLYQDYPTVITATVKEGQPGYTAETAVLEGTSISNAYFNVTGTWKSGLSNYALKTSEYSVPATAPEVEGETAQTVSITVTWEGPEYDGGAATGTCTTFYVKGTPAAQTPTT